MNDLFKALNDPTRRQILELLKERDRTAGEIAEAFSISKPSISHHLELLKAANLVIAIRKGQYIEYSLHVSVMEDAIAWMLDVIKKPKKKQQSAK